MNSQRFFANVRQTLFDGKLTVGQVEGLNVILACWPFIDKRWLAYALATAHHETGRTMQPIVEYGSNEYKRRLYDVTGNDPARARRMGNTTPGDGVKYAGAGYVQLTWKNNYARAGIELNLDLVKKPELARVPTIAAKIMFRGMADGWFTGRKFGDYFTAAKSDWAGARKIINGNDKASLVAGYAVKYLNALM